MKKILSKMYPLALAVMVVGVSVAHADPTQEQQAYCSGQGGYITNNACYIGNPATCNPSSSMTMCFDAAPQAGILLKTCSCGS